ncbi:MAG: Gfo/Idh/MocA family oxidoreductase [Candidatus Omnitrophica bacterium]|nr:Gfo/Idh/MocA family oxidoreductase [Candidatus Omnitrophota bacterium]
MRLILLGAGSIGRRHLQNALALGHEVVAVADPDPSSLGLVRRQWHIPVLTADVSEAFRQRAEAAVICSPTVEHVSQARWAVREGLHVLVEKPLSHTLDQVDELIAEAAAAQRVVLIGCNLRFFPSLQGSAP